MSATVGAGRRRAANSAVTMGASITGWTSGLRETGRATAWRERPHAVWKAIETARSLLGQIGEAPLVDCR